MLLLLVALAGCVHAVPPARLGAEPPQLGHAVHGYVLPAGAAMGSDYCLDPDSPVLRRALTAPRKRPSDRVAARALAADVDALHLFLREQYVGWSELDRHLDRTADAWFDAWARDLREGPSEITVAEGFLDRWTSLRGAHRDMHLALDGWARAIAEHPALAVRELQAPLDGPLAEECAVRGEGRVEPGTLREAVEIGVDGTPVPIVTVSVEGADEVQLVCPDRTHTLRARPRAGRLAEGPVYELEIVEVEGRTTAIVTVRRLLGSIRDLERLSRIAEDYPAWSHADRVVFDFRGNGGGDDGYVWDWVKAAVRGRFDVGESVERVGASGDCSTWNWRVASHVVAREIDTEAARAELARLRAGWTPRETLPSQRAKRLRLTASAALPFQGDVLVLVDRGSVSSGERGPELLALTTGATLVGERTGGWMEYGGVRPFVLPRTGMVVQVPTRRHHFAEPREGVGLSVPVYLAPELLALPARALLTRLSGIPAPRSTDVARGDALPSAHAHLPSPTALP